MDNTGWENFKGSVRNLFTKSKVRTEEALQITQLNQRLRTLRNEKDEGIKKLGEEAYAKWSQNELKAPALQEICDYIKDKELQILAIEKEKDQVREVFAEKIKAVETKKTGFAKSKTKETTVSKVDDQEKELTKKADTVADGVEVSPAEDLQEETDEEENE